MICRCIIERIGGHQKQIIKLLKIGKVACNLGVSRTHIVNGLFDGTLPCEIFSDLGSGTMIYKSNYGGIRSMEKEDIPAVLNFFCEKTAEMPLNHRKSDVRKIFLIKISYRKRYSLSSSLLIKVCKFSNYKLLIYVL